MLSSSIYAALLALTAQPTDTVHAEASEAFARFAQECGRGHLLWGRSLCGPLILVDPATRRATANQDPHIPGFVHDGSLWTGPLPKEVSIANTSITPGGTRFAEVMLPLPSDPSEQLILLSHESFHRIQLSLGYHGREADNGHLDSKDGRILARLEVAALRSALIRKKWRSAARDALFFRSERLKTFPDAESAESALLSNEGLAEYTGVRVGAGDRAQVWAVKDLDSAATRPSLIRTYGYVVGPAYGLLLDRVSKNWRSAALKGHPIPQLLAAQLGGPSRTVVSSHYERDQIVTEETARDRQIQQRRAQLLTEFEKGPTVTFPFEAMNIDFDPNSLFSLGDKGNVYARSTSIRDKWGSFHSTGDVLLSPNWSFALLPGPAKIEGDRLSGPGWSADLSFEYVAKAGSSPGDLVVSRR